MICPRCRHEGLFETFVMVGPPEHFGLPFSWWLHCPQCAAEFDEDEVEAFQAERAISQARLTSKL